jgi:hypothetical protein
VRATTKCFEFPPNLIIMSTSMIMKFRMLTNMFTRLATRSIRPAPRRLSVVSGGSESWTNPCPVVRDRQDVLAEVDGFHVNWRDGDPRIQGPIPRLEITGA